MTDQGPIKVIKLTSAAVIMADAEGMLPTKQLSKRPGIWSRLCPVVSGFNRSAFGNSSGDQNLFLSDAAPSLILTYLLFPSPYV